MPLSHWTEADELLSESLHMRDVALGLDRPQLTKRLNWVNGRLVLERLADGRPRYDADEIYDEDELPAAERELATSTWSRVQNHRDTQLVEGSPVMTSDSTDIHQAMVDAIRGQRWADGAACGISIEYEVLHKAATARVEALHLDEAARVTISEQLDFDAPEWERALIAEVADQADVKVMDDAVRIWEGGKSSHLDEFALLQPAAWKDTVSDVNLPGYVETMLYTVRAPHGISLRVHPVGQPSFSTAASFDRLKPRLVGRGQADRAARVRAHMPMIHRHPDSYWVGDCIVPGLKRRGTLRVIDVPVYEDGEVIAGDWARGFVVDARLDERKPLVLRSHMGASILPERGEAAERTRLKREQDARDRALVEQAERDYVPLAPTLYKLMPDGQLRAGRPGKQGGYVLHKPLCGTWSIPTATDGQRPAGGCRLRITYHGPKPAAPASVYTQHRGHRELDYAATYRDLIRQARLTPYDTGF
jgi:hypothetical protein